MNQAVSTNRINSMDALRAFAMLIGLYIHSTLSFDFEHWAGIKDVSVTTASTVVLKGSFIFFHFSRMQAFFLVAGFFAHMLCHRDGPATMLKNRGKRIFLPFAAGIVCLVPLVQAIRIYGMAKAQSPDASIPWGAIGSYFNSAEFWHRLSPLYLWFLLYLIVFYIVAVFIRNIIERFDSQQRLVKTSDRFIAYLCRSNWAPWILLPPAFAISILIRNPMMAEVGMDFFPEIGLLMMYGLFFLFGWLLHRQIDLLQELGKRWKVHFASGIAVLILTGILAGTMFLVMGPRGMRPPPPSSDSEQSMQTATDNESHRPGKSELIDNIQAKNNRPEPSSEFVHAPSQPENTQRSVKSRRREGPEGRGGPPRPPDLRNAPWPVIIMFQWHRLSNQFLSWAFTLAMVGIFVQYFQKPSPVFRYIADSAYWLYLAHVPVLMLIQIQMAHWAIPWYLKIVLMNGLLFIILLVSYHFLVRSTFIGVILNGRRYPFRFPWCQPPG